MTSHPVEGESLRAAERRLLALDLQDIVTHHLANVALRTMARLDPVEPGDLQEIIAEVHASAGSALLELRLLALLMDESMGEVIGGADRTGAGEQTLPALRQRLTPTQAANRWRQRLTAAGQSAECTVPPAADSVAWSVQSTIARLFEATAEVILAYATIGSRSVCGIAVEASRVKMCHLTTPPPAGVSAEWPGPELAAVRERVDLTQGHFTIARTPRVGSSGPRRPALVINVTLPLD